MVHPLLLILREKVQAIWFLQMILERTGYPLDVTTGQRKYGGPPPNWEGPTPGTGCEVSLF